MSSPQRGHGGDCGIVSKFLFELILSSIFYE